MDDRYREARDAALFKAKPVVSTAVPEEEIEQLHDEWWPGEDESYLTPEMLAAHWKELHPGTEEDEEL
ncbi:hypothetical protein [Thiobacillus sp.]|uniref:hypothetical protein n=1 Tax=Thiobacillus sp. TaxID=924 RepID=UPI0025EAF99A|nr:hypothetical protein [Thiobacillus sp.]MBT9540384.1 hypothetical protein [Thiobacillus sp.]